MPWRKDPRWISPPSKPLLQMNQMELVGYVGHVLQKIELLTERMWALLRLVAVVVVIMLAAYIVQAIQLSNRNHDVHNLSNAAIDSKTAAARAQVAAEETEKTLKAVIEQSRGQSLDPRIARALEQIECLSKGTPCP